MKVAFRPIPISRSMATSNLIRWNGLASVVGGVLLIISDFLELLLVGYDLGEASTTRTYAVVTGLTLLGTVLLLVGLIGLYVGQLENAGLLGLVGFLVTFVGNVLVAGAVWEATFVVPWLAGEAPELLDEVPTGLLALGFISSYTLAGLGVILFGVATIRARVFPTAAAVLLIIGVVPVAVWNFVPLPLPDVLLGVAVAWLGLALFRGGGEGARQAPLSGEYRSKREFLEATYERLAAVLKEMV